MDKRNRTLPLNLPGSHTAAGKFKLHKSLPTPNRVTGPEKRLLRQMLQLLGDPPIELVLWDGEALTTSSRRPVARVHIHSRGALLRLVSNPHLHFGEEYAAGRIAVEGDLVEFLVILYRALWGVKPDPGLSKRLFTWLYRPRPPQPSEKEKAVDNIHHHYDIGNDFYRLWLDEQLVYTCAYYPHPGATLEEAQLAKMDHVCRKLQLKPGDRVVEAGCGWGSLARHMAAHYGVRVTAFNISSEQLRYARQRAAGEGLSGQVQYVEGDFREISGEFDAFVSVGMLEHVGPKYYRQLGHVIDGCLTPKGRGLVHSIGRDRAEPMNAWIEKHIFPCAYPPSLREMMAIFEPNRLSVLDVENLRLHYTRTLEHWLQRFQAAEKPVAAMFDQDFVRTWRLYLAGSIAGFKNGDMQLFQVLFSRSGNNAIPWTRDYMYPH